MFLNVEQLEKQLDKEDFQEIGSMAAFNVLETQFQMFITLRVYLNDEYIAMTCNYFIQYTQQAIPEFCDTLIQHLESVIKSIDERAQLKREYDNWVNERRMQTIEERLIRVKRWMLVWLTQNAVGHNQGMMHMMMMQISDPYTMKSQWLREAASAKPHHMIASSNSRISSKNIPRFSLNDMVHNHYLEEAKEKTQERSRNSEPSLMPSARSKSTANGCTLKPRSNTQTSRNWLASKSSFATTKTVPIAEHPRNSRNDSCVTKFPKEVNSRAKVPSNKTPKRNKPVDQISVPNEQDRSQQDIGFQSKRLPLCKRKQ
nr:hypothetical protein [Tanacetum cinerariifolium]